jgi:lactoylglutathione lyase
MINQLGQVMLYVNDQEKSLAFWTEKAGFSLISEGNHGDIMKWYVIAPTKDAETSIVLHSKEVVGKMSPELNLGTPSLMFFTNEFDELYKNYTEKNIKVGEIVQMPTGRVFNFADSEENYFAVSEKK